MTAADDLRLIGVVNSHELCGWAKTHGGYTKPAVFVAYRARDGYGTTPAWQVIRPGHKTDPGGRWYNYGHKTFLAHKAAGDAAKQAAMAWASEQFDVTEWKRMTGLRSDHFPADLVALAKAAIRDAKRSARTEASR